MMLRSLAAALAVIAIAQPAQAQAPGRGEGVTLMGGAGVGWTRAACNFCRRDRDAGPVIYLQGTAPLKTNLSLGAEGNVWVRDAEVFSLVGALSAIALLNPRPDSPLYLKAGLGFVTYRAFDEEADLVSNGPAMQLGAGYRFPITDELALNSFANVLVSRFGKLRSEENVVVDNFGVTSIQLGVGLTRH